MCLTGVNCSSIEQSIQADVGIFDSLANELANSMLVTVGEPAEGSLDR